MNVDYFPQGIASGKAFLGREQEIKSLKYNIESRHHTLLLAPRRFGKTSLVLHVLTLLDIPHAQTNFFLSRTAKSVERKLLLAIQTVLAAVADNPETLIARIAKFFNQAQKTWSFGFKGIASIEITPDKESDIVDNILTALTLLENFLADSEQKVVLFFDEIQELQSLAEGRVIQAAIREFSQNSRQVIFIFSGSNRRILQDMFDDSSMPLYELCERLTLTRISAQEYKKYLNYVAKKSLGVQLADEVIETILTVTNRHPKRVYNLCYQIWKTSPRHMTTELVKNCWDAYVTGRVADIRFRLSQVSPTELKVLTLIAVGRHQYLTGREAQNIVDAAGATISKALQHLESECYLEQTTPNTYAIIDPLVQTVLERYEKYNIDV